MRLIVCLDEKGGMMFNHRRQSRDRLLMENLEAYVKGDPVYIAPYSQPLFEKTDIHYKVVDDPFSIARDAEYCFIEEQDPVSHEDLISEIVIYHWNCRYPTDVYCTIDMSAYQLIECTDFVGYSHEKITREVWKR